jgi:hypothetical protein
MAKHAVRQFSFKTLNSNDNNIVFCKPLNYLMVSEKQYSFPVLGNIFSLYISYRFNTKRENEMVSPKNTQTMQLFYKQKQVNQGKTSICNNQ